MGYVPRIDIFSPIFRSKNGAYFRKLLVFVTLEL